MSREQYEQGFEDGVYGLHNRENLNPAYWRGVADGEMQWCAFVQSTVDHGGAVRYSGASSILVIEEPLIEECQSSRETYPHIRRGKRDLSDLDGTTWRQDSYGDRA